MALTNEKVLDLVKKLFNQAESEEKIGNAGAAILFAQKAHKLLEDYKLENPLDSLSEIEQRIGKTIVAYPFYRVNAKSKTRIIWYENLAKIVGEANFCKVEIELWIDDIYGYKNRTLKGTEVLFIGTDLERQICVYIFQSLSSLAYNSCNFQRIEQKKKVGTSFTDLKTGITHKNLESWCGDEIFVEKYMEGFISSIEEVFHMRKSIGTSLESNSADSADKILDGTTQLIYNLGREIGNKVTTKISSKSNEEILDKVSTNSHSGDVYLCIDCSGSMYDKLENAKQGALESARNLMEQGLWVGLVMFESYAEHICSPIDSIEQFERSVKRLEVGGSTNMTEGIRQSMYHFTNSSIRRIICVVTDGYPDSSSNALELAKMAKAEGIEITAIGTEDADHDFLKKLCSSERLALSCGSAQLGEGIKEMTANLLVA